VVPQPVAIELDVADAWEPPERPPPRPFIRRTALTLLLLLALLGTLVAARPAASLDARYTVSGEGLQYVRADDRMLYVVRSVERTTRLEAYRLKDGRLLWSVQRGGLSTLVDVAPDRVLLSEVNTSTEAADLIALDGDTGHEVWRRPSAAIVYHDGSSVSDVLMAERAVPGTDQSQPQPLTVLDPATGAVRWTLESPPGSVRTYDYGGTDRTRHPRVSIGQLDPDGTFTLRDGRSGTVLRSARLHPSEPVTDTQANGDWLLTFGTGEPERRTSAVYDLRTGGEVWRRIDRLDDRSSAFWCGDHVLCSSDGVNVTAIDVATGRRLWHTAIGETILATPDDTRLISTSSHITGNGQTVGDSVILDAATGAAVLHLPTWQTIDAASWPRVIAVHPTVFGSGVIAALDAATGDIDVFARVKPLYGPANCLMTADFVVCQADGIAVWPIPSF
jgi:outer membrane protein assembly factor BamB